VLKLRDHWRMLLFFPDPKGVAILLVGPHEDDQSPVDPDLLDRITHRTRELAQGRRREQRGHS
jgi:hypothetical protein